MLIQLDLYILHRKDNNGIVKIRYTSKTAESRANNYTDGDYLVTQIDFLETQLT